MKTQFSVAEIIWARNFWGNLSYRDLIFYWRHYTTGDGAGMYTSVQSDTGFLDYLVLSATQSQFERAYDL